MLDVLIEATLRATLIAAAAWMVLPLLRVRAAAARHRVWTVVLIAMLLLPSWIAWAPDVALRVLPSAPGDSSAVVAPLGGPAGEGLMPMWSAAERGLAPAVAEATGRGGGAAGGPGSEIRRWSWQAGLLGLYLAGVAALLARLAIGTARMRALAREARVVNGRRTSPLIATPYTVGMLKPEILLPEAWERWPAERLEAVLEHERAHVRRRDPLVQWLALLNRAVFWFHPLAWWLERRLAALAEEACDAAVLARGHAPEAYTGLLLDLARMARRRPAPRVAGAAMPGSALPGRIVKILEGRVARPASRAAAAGAAALAGLAAVGLGAITLAQEPAVPPLVPSVDSFTPLPENWFGDDEWHIEVAPLMTPEEKEAYRALRSMEERDRFIGAFWLRRDPTPGTLHNERKKEYERRIHYAEQAFGDPSSPGTFGYRTTRGAAYLLLGEPDSVEAVVEDDGESYEYWRYSNVNLTGDAFTIRLAVSSRLGCGPAYEILEPAPTRVFRGDAWLGASTAGPLTVRTYPLGLVTFSIPVEYGRAERVHATLESGGGGTRAGGLFGFRFRLAERGLPPGKRGITVAGQDGINCTLPMPPGSYRVTAEAELFSRERLTDSVAFDVAAR